LDIFMVEIAYAHCLLARETEHETPLRANKLSIARAQWRSSPTVARAFAEHGCAPWSVLITTLKRAFESAKR
jgi:hypothetical protein